MPPTPSDLPAPLAPIDTLDPVVIIGWYIVFYIMSSLISGIATQIYQRYKSGEVMISKDRELSMKSVVFAGPLEEIMFRGVPASIALYFDLNIVVVLLMVNGVWAGFHYFAFGAFIYTFVLGLFLTRFWYFGFDGLWWMAIVIHSIHNLLAWAGGEALPEDQEVDPRNESTPSTLSHENTRWL